jgi:beta-glucosidase
MRFLPFAVIVVCALASTAPSQPQTTANAVVESRVAGLVSRMTLDEKITLIAGTGFDTAPLERLGIPALRMSDGPSGVREGESTAFPAGVGMAAAFDPDLVERIGRALAREAKAKGKDVLLAPCVNIVRAPHAGRNFESFGEDPYLAARTTVAHIKGVQAEGVLATVKHFAVNNQEHERMTIDAQVDERALHEIYLPAFEAAVKEGEVAAVMSAYNRVNGRYASENAVLLVDILRKRWGFRGLVMSDWGAVHSTAPTILSGLDLEMPTGQFLNPETVKTALRSGEIEEKAIDRMVANLLRLIAATGRLDGRRPSGGAVDTPGHRALALEAARAGIVLLKNDGGVLPLDKTRMRTVAVIGPNAEVARVGGGGSSRVFPPYAVSPLEGLRKKAGEAIRIQFAPGVVAIEDTTPIPPESLRPSEGEGEGLLGEYFDTIDFKGAPRLRRLDPRVSFRWQTGAPAEGMPSDGFSVRWTGRLLPPATGRYVLSLSSNDGARLFLDDEVVIDNWKASGTLMQTTTIDLRADAPKSLRLDYFDNRGFADITLGWRRLEENPLPTAVRAAGEADVALVFAGLSGVLETEGRDRASLALPDAQRELIAAVARANPRTVVVLNSGGPLLMDPWIANVAAVVQAWYPGQEGGNALADVLFGDADPAGRLPITFPRRWEDSPACGRYPGQDGAVRYTEGIFVGYRHFDRAQIEPLFPFGHGLSYTKFRYESLAVSAPSADGKVVVSLEVTNTGPRAGTEVVQLYVGDPKPRLPRPVRELRGFAKLSLGPSERRPVRFTLGREAFAYYDPDRHDWTTDGGPFEVAVGRSSRDLRLKAPITLP